MNSLQREVSEGYLSNWVARLFAQAMDRAIRPHGLSSAYVPVLFALGGGMELTQMQLAHFAAIEQPTMAATLGRMDRDGLLTRRRDPTDGRKSLIGLTPKGRAHVSVVAAAVQQINSRATEGFGEEERRQHRERMLRIVGNLDRLINAPED
ncbi:MarR family winged helix-turn-helix transcriptional regulator [Pelagibacterium lacus]|uniref:MarR family transcriptional regulator n=1 Tax=Pelagibacterium lacus TaxID=2282655 RepID=A0A369W034_9HYPH|nr:MarR family winged helix-turn-helix transcriptional regulator [Pelagibacterium lacus]RDE07918.1 MarR family transcriptional regulator [Pelagibacterium lacus]